MAAAVSFTVVLALLVPFQLALALGAPWGRFTMGGQHDGVLPPRLRVTAAVSVLVYAVLALVVLARAGAVDVLPDGFSRVATWVVFGFFVLNTALNAISRSRAERLVMTPVAAVLAVLALLVALS